MTDEEKNVLMERAIVDIKQSSKIILVGVVMLGSILLMRSSYPLVGLLLSFLAVIFGNIWICPQNSRKRILRVLGAMLIWFIIGCLYTYITGRDQPSIGFLVFFFVGSIYTMYRAFDIK